MRLGELVVDGAVHPVLAEAARASALCNDAALHQSGEGWRAEGDPMEAALLALVLSRDGIGDRRFAGHDHRLARRAHRPVADKARQGLTRLLAQRARALCQQQGADSGAGHGEAGDPGDSGSHGGSMKRRQCRVQRLEQVP